jgi:hypothetical protein
MKRGEERRGIGKDQSVGSTGARDYWLASDYLTTYYKSMARAEAMANTSDCPLSRSKASLRKF